MQLLESDDDPADVLAALRALDGESGAAVTGYLDLVGNRPLDGFDISEPGALELPDALLRAIRVAVAGRDLERADVDEQIAGVRGPGARGAPGRVRRAARRGPPHVPTPRRARRLQRHLGVGPDAAGRARGRPRASPRAAASTIPCTWSTRASTRCARWSPAPAGPSARGARGARRVPRAPTPPRKRRRSSATRRSRRPTRRACRPTSAASCGPRASRSDSLFGSSEAEHEHDVLRGLAASPGVYEGPARCIAGPSEFGRIQQGDVLVTPATTEAFNILLPLLGAIVTDNGGLLSHSAIVAREYGIPGVVGTREATERIADGTRVRVDGDCRRSHGARVTQVVPLAEAQRHSRSSARRRSGSATPSATASRCRPASRSRARSSKRSPPRTRRRSTRSPTAVRAPADAARGALVGRRRGRRRTRASPASTSRCSTCRRSRRCRRRCARSGGRRTRTPRSPTASASGCSRARASAWSSSRCSIPMPPA